MDEREILASYLPEKSIDRIYNILKEKNVHLKISRERRTKLGDYRPPLSHPNHRISINHNLNKYNFFITLVHELAHLYVWEKYKNRVAPHGPQWRRQFLDLLQPFFNDNVLPEDMESLLAQSLTDGDTRQSSDLKLSRILRGYDEGPKSIALEEIDEGAIFSVRGGRQFVKGAKSRTRYKCKCLNNNKYYMVHALAKVEIQEEA